MADWKVDVYRYGAVSAKTIGQMAEDVTPMKQSVIDPHLTKEQADICLNCTRPASKCLGTEACFQARKRKLRKET